MRFPSENHWGLLPILCARNWGYRVKSDPDFGNSQCCGGDFLPTVVVQYGKCRWGPACNVGGGGWTISTEEALSPIWGSGSYSQ